MISMADAIAQIKSRDGEVKFKSQRSELLSILYDYYEKDYPKLMRKTYFEWITQNKKKHCPESVEEFKKTSLFRKKITLKSFCSFWVAHIPTNDLHYLVSIAKDKAIRKESFNKWLFWALRPEPYI